jgi:hypothetical protein
LALIEDCHQSDILSPVFDLPSYTIFRTPLLLHTDPAGNPTDDVGISLIDRLFTNVAQERSLVILDPTMKEQAQEATLLKPPNMPE